MKILTKENFVKFLVKHNACQLYLTLAQNQESAKDIIEKCSDVNYLYWFIKAIGGPLRTKYEEKRVPILVEYYNRQTILLAKYSDKHATILAEYNKQLAPNWAEYDEKCTHLRSKYVKHKAPILAEYDNKCYNLAKGICTWERIREELGE